MSIPACRYEECVCWSRIARRIVFFHNHILSLSVNTGKATAKMRREHSRVDCRANSNCRTLCGYHARRYCTVAPREWYPAEPSGFLVTHLASWQRSLVFAVLAVTIGYVCMGWLLSVSGCFCGQQKTASTADLTVPTRAMSCNCLSLASAAKHSWLVIVSRVRKVASASGAHDLIY